MKNQLLFLATFLSFIMPSLAQDFQGKAIYQSKTSMGDFSFGREMPEDQKKHMMEQSMQGLFLRSIGIVRATGIIGLINLTYNLFRYEQVVQLNIFKT
jgi:hypothetical protein